MKNYFEGDRLCKVCGINIDIPELDILYEIHGICWHTYRKNGWKYEMPKNV